MGAIEKHEMQESIGNGTCRGRFTPEEILDYCEGHVEGLTRLLLAMLPGIDLPRALLLRGRFMAAAAASPPRPVAEPSRRGQLQSKRKPSQANRGPKNQGRSRSSSLSPHRRVLA
jgi:hypothetical protein